MSVPRCLCSLTRPWLLSCSSICSPTRVPYARARFHRCLTEQAYARGPYYGHRNQNEGSSPLSDQDTRLLQVFPYAKDTLLHLSSALQQDKGHNALKLQVEQRSIVNKGTTVWEAVISIKWPSDLIFYGKSTSKVDAQKIAAAQACLALKNMGYLDKNNKPVLYTWENVLDVKNKRYAPVRLSVPAKVITQADQWNRTFYEWCQPLDQPELGSPALNMPVVEELLEEMDSREYFDIVSGEPKAVLAMTELENMSDSLYAQHVRLMKSQNSRVRQMQDHRRELPVFGRREEILETIRNNRVTLISGETGSGKSTQIPQFIFESLISENRGSEAQIIVTQPRRLSAVSLAERVASEREEEVGRTVGYQVRLEATVPPENGCIFFCTTGILLRRLQDNPSLKGVSHVIVDEVHERDVLIDVLLSLLKNLVKVNSDIRIVLMSASLNVDLLKKYFDDCPLLEVEGYLHPVREYFLPEASKLAGMGPPILEDEDPRTPMDLVFNLIKQIDSTRPEGGVLVFLPGWQEIKALKTRILNTFYKEERHCILTLHSMIPLQEQRLVFDTLPLHRRKIVLATNIAETSITINDIVYVVDPGNHRGQTYNPERGITTLDTHWISKANAIQRRGRAGRVRSGECYRLYSRRRFEKMEPFATPEILRMPLEKVILDGKLFCPATTKAADFLSQLPQPPVAEGIEKAIEELIELKVLKRDESLTPLGESVAHFSTHPRLSIALVYAALFRCLNPLLSIASFLSTNRDPFVNKLDNKSYVKEVKERFASGNRSDHIASSNLLSAWLETTQNEEELAHFCDTFGLSHDQLKFIDGIRQVLAEHLYDAYLVENVEDATNHLADVNEHEKNTGLIKAALTAGIGSDLLRVSRGVVKKGRLMDEVVVTMPQSDTVVELSRESVVSSLPPPPQPSQPPQSLRPSQSLQLRQSSQSLQPLQPPQASQPPQPLQPLQPWLIYHSKFKSGESRKTYVKDITETAPVTVALFAGNCLELEEKEDDDVEAVLTVKSCQNVKFYADLKTARVIYELRKNVEELVHLTLQCREKRPKDMQIVWDALRDVLCQMLPK